MDDIVKDQDRKPYCDTYEDWCSDLNERLRDQIQYHDYDRDTQTLFLMRDEDFDQTPVEDLEDRIREDHPRVRVSTVYRPPQNREANL